MTTSSIRALVTDDERRARAAWSVLAEPTDVPARLLWGTRGACESLELALEGPASALADALVLAGEDPAARDIAVVAAHDRARASHLTHPHELAAKAAARWRTRVPHAAEVMEASAEQRIGFSIPGDDTWPPGLSELGINAPVGLWVRSTHPQQVHTADPQRAIALVGSRAATSYGTEVAHDLGLTLAERGITVISGGAFGIDAAAHRGSLCSSSTFPTLAVLAGGLDVLYPRANSALLTEIAHRGALVSEAPLGTTPSRWRFLARNRLIAAMAGASVVVEAAWRSGALSTAAHAEALSRSVGAIPGSIQSPASAGSHRLIRERGAHLVTSADDCMELLPGFRLSTSAPDSDAQSDLDLLTPADRLVYDGIPPRSATTVATLARECALSVEDTRESLARIEVLGLIERTDTRVRRSRER